MRNLKIFDNLTKRWMSFGMNRASIPAELVQGLPELMKKPSGGGEGGTDDYNQLSNLPSINGVVLKGNRDLADVNHTHSYNDLKDKPTIPAAYDDTALVGRVSAIEGKESGWDSKAPGSHTHSYNDLTNKPTIPAAVTDSHINDLIDAKLTPLEALTVSILEVL